RRGDERVRRLALPMDVDQLAGDDLVAMLDRQHQGPVRLCGVDAKRLDEQLVEPAGRDQPVEALIAAPREEGWIGIKQVIETIDQDADRQLVEHRQGPDRGIGNRTLELIVRLWERDRAVVLDTGRSQALAELARQLAKGAVLDRAQGGNG